MEEKILEILEDINEDIIEYDGENMLAESVIDSFEIVEIVARLEEEFDVEIDAKYVVEKNFSNKNAIIKMMKEIVKG